MASKKSKKRLERLASELKKAAGPGKAKKWAGERIVPLPKRMPSAGIASLLQRKLTVVMVVLVLVIIISGIMFIAASKIREKERLEKKLFGFEDDINGTQIQATRDAIKEMIENGVPVVEKEIVLSASETEKDYICAVTTDKGIITLKKRGELIREEVVREGYNLSILFIDNKFYMYHPLYNIWAMFDYDPSISTSGNPIKWMSFSMADLKAINSTGYSCIETALPEKEFSLGDIGVIDADEYVKRSNPFR